MHVHDLWCRSSCLSLCPKSCELSLWCDCALVYEEKVTRDKLRALPRIVCIITGKGS